MKKVLGLLILAAVIVCIILLQQKNTLEDEMSNFSIENIDDVNQIYFADKMNNEVTLIKENNSWMVDEEYPVRNEAIELLFSTLEKMKIKYPVSESMHNSVIKELATQGVKLELYSGDESLMKTIYIGGETADFLGTYMMIDGSEKAYVMHLPGFNGFLSPRFNIDGRKVTSQIWRSRKIFKGSMIDSLRMEFHDEPTKNFFLSTKESLIIYGNNQKQKIDSNSIKNYLNLIKTINCEGYVNDLKSRDSILTSEAVHTFTIYYTDKTSVKLNTFRKKWRHKTYITETQSQYDVDRLYGYNGNDFMLIQNYAFNPVFNPSLSVEK